MWDIYLQNRSISETTYAAPGNSRQFSNIPQTYLVTVELDPLRDEAEAYGQVIQAAGVPVIHTFYPGVPHFFLLAPEAPFFNTFTQDLAEQIRHY